MALSGSFQTAISNSRYILKCSWSATQSITGNYSDVTITTTFQWTAALNIGARTGAYTKVDGVGTEEYSTSSISSNSGTRTFNTHTFRVYHNTNGVASVDASAYFPIKATISGTYYGSMKATGTINLNTIPRHSEVSIASPSYMSDAIDVGITQKSTSFSTQVFYKTSLMSDYDYDNPIAQTSGTSTTQTTSWNVPDITSSLPNTDRDTYSFLIRTYLSTDYTGSYIDSTKSMVAIVPLEAVPTISITDIRDLITTPSGWGYVVGYSQLEIDTAFTGYQGSTRASITAQFGSETPITYTDETTTIDEVGYVSTTSFNVVVSVTDSRGRTAATTETITAITYAIPQISIEVTRCDANGDVDATGTSALINAKWSITDVATNKNTATIVVGDQSYSIGQVYTKTDWTFIAQLDNDYSINSDYDITATITDAFKSNSTTRTLNKSIVPLSTYYDDESGEYGTTLNQIALETGFHSYYDENTFHKDVQFVENQDINLLDTNGTIINTMTTNDLFSGSLQAVYPVGSIYMSVNNTNPAELFGFGTWEQIKDKFLLSAGDTYNAGDSGGSATHNIANANLPTNMGNFTHYGYASGNVNSGIITVKDNSTNKYALSSNGNVRFRIASFGGSGTAINHMPPYLTVYMWQRTA